MMAVTQAVDSGPGPAVSSPALVLPTADDETNSAVAHQVRAGQAVVCSDGRAGRVVATMSDPAGILQHVAVRLGHWWGRTVTAPAGWIEAVDPAGVRLAVERRRLQDLPDYRVDSKIAAAARAALWDDVRLRRMSRDDITVAVCDGVVTLSGHVATAADRRRAGRAIDKVRGARAFQNELVADDDLVNLVAQALADDERTHAETIFVAVHHGIVILSGLWNSALARAAAEECAAAVPFVRGVNNYIQAPGTVGNHAEAQTVQPRFGQEVFASDMALGRVERLIIDPLSRRVAAMVVIGRFPDLGHAARHMRSYEMPTQERHVVIPISAVGFVTATLVQLNVAGMVAARWADFAPSNFPIPDKTWRPPYPFAVSECLWTRK